MQHWIIEYENENIDEIIQFFNQLIIDFETYNTKFNWFENTESIDLILHFIWNFRKFRIINRYWTIRR